MRDHFSAGEYLVHDWEFTTSVHVRVTQTSRSFHCNGEKNVTKFLRNTEALWQKGIYYSSIWLNRGYLILHSRNCQFFTHSNIFVYCFSDSLLISCSSGLIFFIRLILFYCSSTIHSTDKISSMQAFPFVQWTSYGRLRHLNGGCWQPVIVPSIYLSLFPASFSLSPSMYFEGCLKAEGQLRKILICTCAGLG